MQAFSPALNLNAFEQPYKIHEEKPHNKIYITTEYYWHTWPPLLSLYCKGMTWHPRPPSAHPRPFLTFPHYEMQWRLYILSESDKFITKADANNWIHDRMSIWGTDDDKPKVRSSYVIALPIPVPPPVTIATQLRNKPGRKTDMMTRTLTGKHLKLCFQCLPLFTNQMTLLALLSVFYVPSFMTFFIQ